MITLKEVADRLLPALLAAEGLPDTPDGLAEFDRRLALALGTNRDRESDGRSDESLTVARNPLHSNENQARATAKEVEVSP